MRPGDCSTNNYHVQCLYCLLINSSMHYSFRFILFEKEDDGIGKPIEKFKDDRRQLRSVTTALQLPTTLKLDKFINDYVLDVNKVGRGNDVQLNHESSSSSELEDSFEECSSDNEDLTEPCSY